MTTTYHIGDCVESLKGIADRSVHFSCCSPPYWALRNYSNLAGQHGLEESPADYIAQQMQVFDEVQRVLRDDGSLVVNLGDTFNANQGAGFNAQRHHDAANRNTRLPQPSGIQPKSLCLIPYRFALAMLDHGWICRNVIVWKKKSAMPTSARDRMRCSWEPCFVFVKKGRYYSDVEAVRVQSATAPHAAGRADTPQYGDDAGNRKRTLGIGSDRPWAPGGASNPGDVLTLGPQPSNIEHYAMYPVRLPLWFMRWLMPRKVCSECGMAWGRVTETDYRKGYRTGHLGYKARGGPKGMTDMSKYPALDKHTTTLHWEPRCKCGAEPVGPTILDCYAGPGTTAAAAEWLWTHKDEGYDTILADPKMVATRPAKTSKHHEGDGSQRPEYAKARMVRTGKPTNVYCEWLPGEAIMLDLDGRCEQLHQQRLDECFDSLTEGPGKAMKYDLPLLKET